MRALGSFGPAASSVPEARHFVRNVTERQGEQELAKAAELLVSELVTNAVRHAHSSVHIEVDLDDRRLRVEVRDDGVGTPRIERESVWSDHGRGLVLVARISDRWGVEPADHAKCVWFELASR